MAMKPPKKKPPKQEQLPLSSPIEVPEESFLETEQNQVKRYRRKLQREYFEKIDGGEPAVPSAEDSVDGINNHGKDKANGAPVADFDIEIDDDTAPEYDESGDRILYESPYPNIYQDCHGRHYDGNGVPLLYWYKDERIFCTSIGECWTFDGKRLPNSSKHLIPVQPDRYTEPEGVAGADLFQKDSKLSDKSNEVGVLLNNDNGENSKDQNMGFKNTDLKLLDKIDGPELTSPEINSIVAGDGFQVEFVDFFKKIKRIINNGSDSIVKQITIKEDREDVNIRTLSPVQKSTFIYDLLNELNGENSNPQIYVNPQGKIVQIRLFGRDNQIVIVELKKADLQFIIIRRANFITINQRGDINYTMLDNGSWDDVFATQDKPLSMLESVKPYPFFDENHTLQNVPGYNEKTMTILDIPSDLELYEVDEAPSQESIEKAKSVIVGGLFAGFKFETFADLAHAVALFLLFFIRDLIKGPTPIHIVESSEFGAGKTFLVECIIRAVSGLAPEETTFPTSDSEFRRQLLAHLIKGGLYLFIDNLGHHQRLSSAELAQTTTSTVKSGRILGQSRIVDFVVKMIFIISGVNINIDRELLRRSIRIRLIKTDSYPNRDHLAWIRKNRPEILWAALTLIQAWISKGRPLADKCLRSFDRWAEIVGGILEVAGIEGFLENQDDFMRGGDPEFDSYIALVTIWWQVYGEKKVLSRDLMGLIVNEGIPIPLEGRSNVNKATSLGYLLRSLKDRQIDNYKITDAGLRSGSRLWRLIETT